MFVNKKRLQKLITEHDYLFSMIRACSTLFTVEFVKIFVVIVKQYKKIGSQNITTTMDDFGFTFKLIIIHHFNVLYV